MELLVQTNDDQPTYVVDDDVRRVLEAVIELYH